MNKVTRKIICLLFYCITVTVVFSQSQFTSPEFKGYLKYLSSGSKFNIIGFDNFVTSQLIHQRLNINWDLNTQLTFKAAIRNQLFFGEAVKLNNTLAEQLKESQNDYFGLSLNVVNSRNAVFNSTIDRFFFESYFGDFEISIGRQRINWGINTIWNPNDIFNTFSFVDFDYEERPGSDAALIRYYFGLETSFEIASKFHGNKEEMVIGSLFKFNKGTYDIQLLMAYANAYWTIGSGWAGNIKNAGWKSEWSWFIADLEERDNSFSLSTAVDYSFNNGLYLSGGYLFNSSGSSTNSIVGLFDLDINARNLYPFKHAFLIAAAYPISPLINTNASIVYSPASSHPLFFSPAVSYSISQNWDLDFISQLVFEKGDSYYSPLQSIYIRVKWSF